MRLVKDKVYTILTWIFSIISFILLFSIVLYIFSNGLKLFNFKLIISDYHTNSYVVEYKDKDFGDYTDYKPKDDEYYSEKWGIAFKDSTNKAGDDNVIISFVHKDSVLRKAKDKSTENGTIEIKENFEFQRALFENGGTFSSRGAKIIRDEFDNNDEISQMTFNYLGGGIRGSIVATVMIIFITIIIALPLGVLTAIYLNEFSPKNRIANIIRSSIELLAGIPSIIFGMVGLILFVPLTMTLFNFKGGNLISGSLTLTIMLLPIIIRTTEESLRTISDDYRTASLALGANKVQTIIKVIIPQAIPGILAATIMAIGRIIGESAALIFAIGTHINDRPVFGEKATTLSVHIWSVMQGEIPNFELASTISIIILIIVFSLNFLSKLLVKKLRKV